MNFESTLVADGVTIAWEQHGAGEPVVFVHGLINDKRYWAGQRPYFAGGGHRFVAYDMRHHGWSTRGEAAGPYTRERHVPDMLKVLETVALVPACVVAHSYAANVAVEALLRWPQRFRCAVLVEPSLDGLAPPGPDGAAAVAELRECMQRALQAMHAGGDEAAMRVLAEWVDNGHVKRWSALDSRHVEQLAWNAATLRLRLGSRDPAFSIEQVRSISVPVLVVNGLHTRPYFRQLGRHVASLLRAGDHAELAGASHDVALQVPEAFAHRVQGFFERTA